MKKTYKYQIVGEERHPRGHVIYHLQYKMLDGRISEKFVGKYQLRAMAREGRLGGHMSDQIRAIIDREPSERKGRVAKKEVEPKMYSLPDVFEVEKLISDDPLITRKWG